jgi:Right handed beta helix region
MKNATFLLIAAVCLQTAWAKNINVPSGGDLQAALNAAQPGDTVTLAAGATYAGHFYLSPNSGSQWITIQSSAMNSLPAGTRISPGKASALAKVITPDGAPVLAVASGANYYRIQGIEFAPASGIYAQDLVQIGTGSETSNGQLPHDLDFDRDYIHGDPSAGSKRGVTLNGINITVENCYFSAFTSNWQDTQALAGWNGPGPYTIANNYLEAGTEIVAFGGAAVTIPGNVPSDITIRNNTFFKPLSWRDARVWAKNHVELKNARRVTIDGNTFTNNWIGADQQGFLFMFSVRTESGAVPWAVVSDVTVKNNVIRHSAAGVFLTGHDHGTGSAGNFQIQNNVWEDISGTWGGDGRLFEILNDTNGATFDRNTAFQTGYAAVFDEGPSRRINFTNNIFLLGWGVAGNSRSAGIPTLSTYAGGGVFAGNLLIGITIDQYPANNYFVPAIAQVGFIDFDGENFQLAPNSAYKGKATDGGDIGSSL